MFLNSPSLEAVEGLQGGQPTVNRFSDVFFLNSNILEYKEPIFTFTKAFNAVYLHLTLKEKFQHVINYTNVKN